MNPANWFIYYISVIIFFIGAAQVKKQASNIVIKYWQYAIISINLFYISHITYINLTLSPSLESRNKIAANYWLGFQV